MVTASIRLARIADAVRSAYRAGTPWDAESKCLLTASAAALLAHEEGIDCWMAAFLLSPEEEYCDHWVVALEPGLYLIDPSYPQVTGQTRIATDRRYDYPLSYHGPLWYPAAAVLAAGGADYARGARGAHRRLLHAMRAGTLDPYDGGIYRAWIAAHTDPAAARAFLAEIRAHENAPERP